MKRTMTAATMLPLAIGLAAKAGPTVAAATTAATSTSASATAKKAKAPCFAQLSDCPPPGCADADTPDGLTNTLKRTTPAGTNPHFLTFGDFGSLQTQTENLVGTKKVSLTSSQHAKLKNMTVHDGKVTDGDVVMVTGFIVGEPHPNTRESVNCNLTKASNNDIHITLAEEAGSDEMDGFVVEMIPQDRPARWSSTTLKKVETSEQQVLVIGRLFYDSKHHVNDDPEVKDTGDPKRMSLWEVHPISEFLVCTGTKACDPKKKTDWTKLEDVP
jgi:hypothetical protein